MTRLDGYTVPRAVLLTYLLGGLVKVGVFFAMAVDLGISVWEMPMLTALVVAHGLLVPWALLGWVGLGCYGVVALVLFWRHWRSHPEPEVDLA